MPSFSYIAKDRSGKESRGIIEGVSVNDAAARLRQDNLFVTKLEPISSSGAAVGKKKAFSSSKKAVGMSPRGKVPLKEKMFMVKQFQVMQKAGMGMLICLNNLFDQAANPHLKYILNQARTDVESGISLSDSFAKFPKVFDQMVISMIQAGEATGKLDTSFERINGDMERTFNLQKKIKGAMMYPMIIVCVAIMAVWALLTFVFPTITSMFAESGVKMPGITQFVLNISNFLRSPIGMVVTVAVVFGGTFGFKTYKNTPVGKATLDRLWLTMPVVGPLVRNVLTARFARAFASLLDSGVPLLRSMEIVERVVNNDAMAKGVHEAAMSVNRGTGLARPLLDTGIFPLMVSQMVAIGEDTGDLGKMLTEVADYYDKEVEYALEAFTAALEPMILVGLGGVIGVIVVAMILPILEMTSGATIS